MSIKFNNIPSEWYKENKPKMLLHEETENTISRWIALFDKVAKEYVNHE